MLPTHGPAPIDGVIFDFHSTLVDGGDPGRWIDDALRRLPGRTLDDDLRKELHTYLDHIWQHAHLVDPDSDRDLSPDRHREVFTRTLTGLPGLPRELIGALYATMTDQWVPFDDAVPVLRTLKDRGVRTVVLSNIGIDIRDGLRRNGLDEFLDGVLLSCEAGVVKPDPAIFTLALGLLGTPAERTLMVGDSARDDTGGATLGIRTLILPRTRGPVHGLETVLRLVGPV